MDTATTEEWLEVQAHQDGRTYMSMTWLGYLDEYPNMPEIFWGYALAGIDSEWGPPNLDRVWEARIRIGRATTDGVTFQHSAEV